MSDAQAKIAATAFVAAVVVLISAAGTLGGEVALALVGSFLGFVLLGVALWWLVYQLLLAWQRSKP